jgi:hypothetical protein
MYYVIGYSSKFTNAPAWRESLAVSEAEVPAKVRELSRMGFKAYIRPATGGYTSRTYSDSEIRQHMAQQRVRSA